MVRKNHVLYSRNVLQAPCNYIFGEIHMFHPYQNGNLSLYTVKSILLETPHFDLDIKIWFPFHHHVPFHN